MSTTECPHWRHSGVFSSPYWTVYNHTDFTSWHSLLSDKDFRVVSLLPPSTCPNMSTGDCLVSDFRRCFQACIRPFLNIQTLLIVTPYYPIQISGFLHFCHLAPALTCQPRGSLINDIRGRFQVHIGLFLTIRISLTFIPYYPIQISVFFHFCCLAPTLTCQPWSSLVRDFRGLFQVCIRPSLTVQILLIVIPYYPMQISMFFHFCHLPPALTC